MCSRLGARASRSLAEPPGRFAGSDARAPSGSNAYGPTRKTKQKYAGNDLRAGSRKDFSDDFTMRDSRIWFNPALRLFTKPGTKGIGFMEKCSEAE